MADLPTIDYGAVGSSIGNVISQSIPPEVFLWIKIALIVIVIYFAVLIIKNLIQIGAAWRIRKISKNVEQINNKMDMLIQPQSGYDYTK